jgi:hypothetical protein
MKALEIDCPTCRAKAGVHCKRPSGHRIFGGGEHASREKAAELRHQTTGSIADQIENATAEATRAGGGSFSGQGKGFRWSLTIGSISIAERR